MSASPKAHACTRACVSSPCKHAAADGGSKLTLCMVSMLMDTAAACAWASAGVGRASSSTDIEALSQCSRNSAPANSHQRSWPRWEAVKQLMLCITGAASDWMRLVTADGGEQDRSAPARCACEACALSILRPSACQCCTHAEPCCRSESLAKALAELVPRSAHCSSRLSLHCSAVHCACDQHRPARTAQRWSDRHRPASGGEA